jgi:septin family protein
LELNGFVEPDEANVQPINHDSPIKVYETVDVDTNFGKAALTLIDTPGLPYNMEQSNQLNTVMAYIEAQFEALLIEELKVKRNPKSSDTLVHAVLYLLPPMLPFHPVDLAAIQALSTRVNVIPLLAHADSITSRQLQTLKENLFARLQEGMNLLEFLNQEVEEGEEVDQEDEEEYLHLATQMRNALPYTIIGAEFPIDGDSSSVYLEQDGKKILGRQYKWGIVNVDDEQHCELYQVKHLLFDFSFPALRAHTRDVLYEFYRTERLMAHAGKPEGRQVKEE